MMITVRSPTLCLTKKISPLWSLHIPKERPARERNAESPWPRESPFNARVPCISSQGWVVQPWWVWGWILGFCFTRILLNIC